MVWYNRLSVTLIWIRLFLKLFAFIMINSYTKLNANAICLLEYSKQKILIEYKIEFSLIQISSFMLSYNIGTNNLTHKSYKIIANLSDQKLFCLEKMD